MKIPRSMVSMVSPAVATVVGIISGVYIFKPVFEPPQKLALSELKSESEKESRKTEKLA